MARLDRYSAKRDFSKTTEPRARKGGKSGDIFVVQKHSARRLHYDFRLALDGVLKSWAVTRGPSLVPGEKRLAVHVEDHPYDYAKFEGVIPEGQYGAGPVIVWDFGRWIPEGDPHKDYRNGRMTFTLEGKKLKGRWHLIRMREHKGERRDQWLLIKADDNAARPALAADILKEGRSVLSGRSIDEMKKGQTRSGKARQAGAMENPKVEKAGKGTSPSGMLTHPEKLLWEDVGVSKRDLAAFYRRIWKWIAPYVTDRPLALVRCPEGTAHKCFFQKHAWAGLDGNLVHRRKSRGEEILSIDSVEGLIALVQADVLEIHPWATTTDDLEHADQITFDLDPGEGVAWKEVVAAARLVRKKLEAAGLAAFLKTTGGKGLHVVVPLKPPAKWDDVKAYARGVALELEGEDPDRFIATSSKRDRAGRIFVDYLRNSRGATAIAGYSTRARANAPVSTPLAWDELTTRLHSDRFTVANIEKRLAGLKSDPWKGFRRSGKPLPAAGGATKQKRKA